MVISDCSITGWRATDTRRSGHTYPTWRYGGNICGVILIRQEIVRVIIEYLPDRLTRAKRMMYSLKVYGQYRYDFGDPRISIILAVDERKLKLPNPEAREVQCCSITQCRGDAEQSGKGIVYRGDRAGIWLGLLLRGVPASAVKTVEIIGKHQIRFKNWTKLVELRVQEWLIINMLRMPEDKWRINRVTIQKRIRENMQTR